MRKIISWITLLAIATSILIPVGAVDTAQQATRESVIENVKEQLSKQDALDKLELFMPTIDAVTNYNAQSDIMPIGDEDEVVFYAPDGGWVRGTGSGYEQELIFLNPEKAEAAYAERHNITQTILLGILCAPVHWSIGVTVGALSMWGTNYMWDSVNKGENGIISSSVYDHIEGKTITVLFEWSEYSRIDPADYNLNNLSYGRFEPYEAT